MVASSDLYGIIQRERLRSKYGKGWAQGLLDLILDRDGPRLTNLN